MQGYYSRALTRSQKEVYDILKQRLYELSTSIRIPKLEAKELGEIYLRLKLDEPLLFYVTGYSYRFYPEANHVEFIPVYLFDKKKIREQRKAVEVRIQRLIRPIQDENDIEKEKAIHDFILNHVRYDKLKKAYSHEIIGPLTQGVGVCEGIAKTVKVLCDAVNIPCVVALSYENPEKEIKYRHAWNVVKVNGKNYHVDATFDNSLQQEEKRYDYFNLSDKNIFKDHEKLVMDVPKCTDEAGFFYHTVSFTKMNQVESRIKQTLRKKKKNLIFHWQGGEINHIVLEKIMNLACTAAAEKEMNANCSVNISQSVIQLHFSEKNMQEIIFQNPDAERNETINSADN